MLLLGKVAGLDIHRYAVRVRWLLEATIATGILRRRGSVAVLRRRGSVVLLRWKALRWHSVLLRVRLLLRVPRRRTSRSSLSSG